MTPERRPDRDGVEVLMLIGAWLAPFNFFLGVQIGGLYLRPLHVWAIVAVLALLAVDRRNLAAAIDWPVLAFWTTLAFIVLSTLFGTPAQYKFRGVADVGLLSLNIVAFTVVRAYYDGRPAAWHRFFISIAISSVIMSFGLTVRAVMAGNTGVAVGVDSYALGLGTVAGTYTATFAAATAAAIVFATTRRQLIAALVAFVVHGNAAVFSLARGPWLAFFVAMLSCIPLLGWKFRSRFSAVRTGIRGTLAIISMPLFFRGAIVVNPFIRGLLVQRVVQVVNLEAGTGSSRLIMWQAFLRDAQRSPVFGRGAAAYRDVSDRLAVQGTVSENFLVEMLHAGGIVAAFFLVIGIIGVGLNCLRRAGAEALPAYTAACLTGSVALVAASMTNPAAWNGLFWVLLGLSASRAISTSASAERSPGDSDSPRRERSSD